MDDLLQIGIITHPRKHLQTTLTCDFCFHRSTHIHLEDYRDSLGRDVMRYGCDDVKACLERIEIRRDKERK